MSLNILIYPSSIIYFLNKWHNFFLNNLYKHISTYISSLFKTLHFPTFFIILNCFSSSLLTTQYCKSLTYVRHIRDLHLRCMKYRLLNTILKLTDSFIFDNYCRLVMPPIKKMTQRREGHKDISHGHNI